MLVALCLNMHEFHMRFDGVVCFFIERFRFRQFLFSKTCKKNEKILVKTNFVSTKVYLLLVEGFSRNQFFSRMSVFFLGKNSIPKKKKYFHVPSVQILCTSTKAQITQNLWPLLSMLFGQ